MQNRDYNATFTTEEKGQCKLISSDFLGGFIIIQEDSRIILGGFTTWLLLDLGNS